jgi:hypothetical protein
MGYELNKLMMQYGLATPTMLSYEGERGPDVETINEETGEVTTTPGEITFDPAKQAAFDQYQKEYQFRLNNAPMYAGSQYRTRPAQQQPQTYEDMFTMYLGRPMGDGERNRFPSTTGPLSDAQRNEFLRIYEPEFADLGINNTGNQLVMDQIGNYYGNILRNPNFAGTPPTPVDRSAPFIERNPTVVNPNPPSSGPFITTDEGYENAVIDGEVQQSFLDFAAQQDQNLANIANPLPDETILTIEDARNLDPFAESSVRGVPAYGAYLGKNLDVLDDIMNQPGYLAFNIPQYTPERGFGGFVPGSPEDEAVKQYVAKAAKDHFVNHGFQEGRKFYKKGGEVKGFQEGGGDTTGLSELIIQQQVGGGPQTAAQAMGETSTAGIGGTNNNQQQTSNPDLQDEMINTLIAAAPPVEKLYGQTMAASKGFTDAQLNFNTTVEDIISARQEGPDKAELYFKLAAAFAQPTKTQSFGFLENVPTVLADFAKDTRDARNKGQQMEITLAKSKLAQAKSKYDALQNKRTTQGENYRKYMMDLYKIIAEKDKEAADRLLKRQKFEFDKKTLPPEIIKIKKADEEGLKDLTEGLSELRKGLKFNKKAGASDSATMYRIRLDEGTGNLSPKDRNTLLVMNIIGAFAVKQLKNTFGAQLSDGERKAFFSLMGAGEYPDAKMREMIIGRLINQTIKTINQKRERLGRINAGTYQTTADDLTLGRGAELTEEEQQILSVD